MTVFDRQNVLSSDVAVRTLPSIFPQLYHRGSLYASIRNRVVVSDDMGATWRSVCVLPPTPVDRATRFRLVDRFMNWSILNVTRTPSGTLLIVGRRTLFRFSTTDEAPTAVFDTRHKHSPMHRGLCVSHEGTVYLAEYRDNAERGPIHVYRSADDGRTWDVALRFPPGEVRHVHAIHQDPFVSERIWLLTGDLRDECRIGFTTDGFDTLQIVGSGSQLWRATALLFSREHIYWGMDSPLETSHIQRLNLQTGALDRLQELDGPAYYGTANEQGRMFLGTTVESGPAVKDKIARVWTSQDGESWRVLRQHRASRLPQNGIIYFPSGILPEDYLIYRCRALAGVDDRAFVCRVPIEQPP